MHDRTKIYFAGPDVFLPSQARDIHFNKILRLANQYDFEALLPIDNEDSLPGLPRDVAIKIYQFNMLKLEQASVVIANMNPFRGLEPDSGTVFEVGAAVAKNKPVVLYARQADLDYASKLTRGDAILQAAKKLAIDHLHIECGEMVENFDLPFNLMLAGAATGIVQGGVEDAVKFTQQLGLLVQSPQSFDCDHEQSHHLPASRLKP